MTMKSLERYEKPQDVPCFDNAKKIEELQNQLELVAEAPYVGICIFNESFIYVNHVLEHMLGYTMSELQEIAPIDLLHLENKQEYIYNFRQRLEGKQFLSMYRDAKLLTKEGRDIFVRLCIKTVTYQGKPAALASVVDISGIVEQEQKTKRLAQALEQTDDLLLMTDSEGKMLYVNSKLLEKTGYSKKELIGKKTSIFKSGKHSKRFYKRLWDTILSGKKYHNTLINKTKKGKLLYLETTITPVFDNEGGIESFVATAKDISYEVKTKKRLKNLAMTDMLTKVLNRYAIDKEIDYHLSLAQREKTSFSVLMFDLDHFKNINDKFGHYTGDIVLKYTTKLLNAKIRKIDKIGRWGGEEFIVILHGVSKTSALQKAEELRRLIEDNIIENKYHITVSIGVTSYEEGDTRDTLIKRVDTALYKAKEQGRNRVVVL